MIDKKKKFFAPLNKKLKALYTKYKENQYAIQKLDSHLDKELPKLMKSWNKSKVIMDNPVDKQVVFNNFFASRREVDPGTQEDNLKTVDSVVIKKVKKVKKVKKATKAKDTPVKNKKIRKTKSTRSIRGNSRVIMASSSANQLQSNIPNALVSTNSPNSSTIRPKTPEMLQAMINKYYYLPTMKIFVTCENNAHYRMISEENVWFDIMKKIISIDRKYKFTNKVKKEIFRQIKNKTILDATPMRRTVQFVLYSFMPILSNVIADIKYFLIVIGDSILNKTPSHITYYMVPETKPFMSAIVNGAMYYFKNSIRVCRGLKHKPSDKDCEHICDLRIIRFKHSIVQPEIWSPFLKYHFLDFLVVCCYLSNLHKSAEHYLDEMDKDSQIVKKVKFTTYHNGEDNIFDHFLSSKIVVLNKPHASTKYRLNDMLFLWKLYLMENHLPDNIIKKSIVKRLMYQKIPNAKRKYFTNIDSDMLKMCNYLTIFWSETITLVKKRIKLQSKYSFVNFAKIFKRWVKNNYQEDTDMPIGIIEMLINHYHIGDDLIHMKNNTIYGIYCSEWDKRKDINRVLRSHKDKNPQFNILNMSGKHIEELYRYYVSDYVDVGEGEEEGEGWEEGDGEDRVGPAKMGYDEFKSIIVDKILIRRDKTGL